MDIQAVIHRPMITEKSLKLADSQRYTFAVAREANKSQIAQAVTQLFGVEVIEVKTFRSAGKQRRFGKQRQVKRLPGTKKAIVRVKSDQKIDLFEIKEQK